MDSVRRMQALLYYANSAKVARGLTERGYPVSGPTVSRWAKGQNVTARAVELVQELLGQQENAAPDWERLQRQVDAIADKLDVSLDEEQEAARAAAAGLPRLPLGESGQGPLEDDRAVEAPPGGHGEEE